MAMFPPLFETIKGVAAVKAIFGSSPRVYPHGMAPQKGSPGYGVPYAVQQLIFGNAENYLAGVPDMDGFTVQIDVYAATVKDASDGAEALRDALEPVAGYVDGYGGQRKDAETGLFRYTFDVGFNTPR